MNGQVAAVAVAGFAMAFIASLSIVSRIDYFGSVEEQNLPWSERMGRRNARRYAELMSPRFRTARKMQAWGFFIFASSLGVVFLLSLAFGNPS
jgi:hypothetical protein